MFLGVSEILLGVLILWLVFRTRRKPVYRVDTVPAYVHKDMVQSYIQVRNEKAKLAERINTLTRERDRALERERRIRVAMTAIFQELRLGGEDIHPLLELIDKD